MNVHALGVRPKAVGRVGLQTQRLAFVVLMAMVPLLPHLSSDGFSFPAVANFWVTLPFAVLFLLPLIDLRTRATILHLDLLALVSMLVALGCERPGRLWPVVLLYPPLLYLAVRMVRIARVGRQAGSDTFAPRAPASVIPRSWLLVGIVVLASVHLSWALDGSANTDVAAGSVRGAVAILDGRPVYDATGAHGAQDPHTDTYGPVNYEAYVPLAAVANRRTAARLSTLAFDLLAALLLFLLGRAVRGPSIGVLLAFCWLAFPFTLYEEALGFNDSLVAAALLGTLLAAASPVRRGVMAAVAAWSKLSPLALVPLLAVHDPRAAGGAWRRRVRFALAFAAASVLIFLPVLWHDSPGTIVSRTFGFQAQRPPGGSAWAVLQGGYAERAPWIGVASRIVHGVVVALAGTFVILLVRAPRRRDIVSLAGASGAILIALEICLSYFAFSYILWFAPLVLVAVVLSYPAEGSHQAGAFPTS
jgi:Glycosyltransferase family 87